MNPPTRVSTWLSATRPRTLPAAIAPVLVGTALAWRDGHFVAPAAAACLGFALLVQIGTNFANDYFDFIKGADTAERVGPRRAVASGWVKPPVMRAVAIAVFAAAFLLGLTLIPYGGTTMIVIGVASILSGIAYTGGPYPLAYHGWGDVFVFVFFGLVAVCTTYFVQGGVPDLTVWMVAVAIGALSANILLVNNYRDATTDAKAGKKTTVVRFGPGFARAQFTTAHVIALTVPSYLALLQREYALFLPVILTPLALRQVQRLRDSRTPSELIALLGDTGRYLALYAVVLSGGIVLARL